MNISIISIQGVHCSICNSKKQKQKGNKMKKCKTVNILYPTIRRWLDYSPFLIVDINLLKQIILNYMGKYLY